MKKDIYSIQLSLLAEVESNSIFAIQDFCKLFVDYILNDAPLTFSDLA